MSPSSSRAGMIGPGRDRMFSDGVLLVGGLSRKPLGLVVIALRAREPGGGGGALHLYLPREELEFRLTNLLAERLQPIHGPTRTLDVTASRRPHAARELDVCLREGKFRRVGRRAHRERGRLAPLASLQRVASGDGVEAICRHHVDRWKCLVDGRGLVDDLFGLLVVSYLQVRVGEVVERV
jgi:hypothetical protein